MEHKYGVKLIVCFENIFMKKDQEKKSWKRIENISKMYSRHIQV